LRFAFCVLRFAFWGWVLVEKVVGREILDPESSDRRLRANGGLISNSTVAPA
jgi:hypothetical protein